jgi:hypothetical protein
MERQWRINAGMSHLKRLGKWRMVTDLSFSQPAIRALESRLASMESHAWPDRTGSRVDNKRSPSARHTISSYLLILGLNAVTGAGEDGV